jgi:hypothetical protein
MSHEPLDEKPLPADAPSIGQDLSWMRKRAGTWKHRGRSVRSQVGISNLVWFVIVMIAAAFTFAMLVHAETVPVRYREGLVHGFLVVRTLDGEAIASGDLTQVSRGNRVTTELAFHFKDGSINDETADYTQDGTFRLLKDHLIQKGPSFKHASDVTLDATTGQFINRYTDDDGKEKVITEKVDVPPDVSNGMILTLLTNLRPGLSTTTVSMVAATPKPRLVKLVITPRGTEPFLIGGSKREATHYVIKIDLKGAAKVVAPLVGKEPTDINAWILGGSAPGFVKMESALYDGGPTWRIELATPNWPNLSAGN